MKLLGVQVVRNREIPQEYIVDLQGLAEVVETANHFGDALYVAMLLNNMLKLACFSGG